MVIVTFLGAVHWGVAMATPLTSHIAVKLANESFVYSVIPSLVAWPIALMEPGTLGDTKLSTGCVGWPIRGCLNRCRALTEAVVAE